MTEEELEEELDATLQELGIEPDAHGYYHREQFLRAWEILQWHPGITDDDRRNVQRAIIEARRRDEG